MLEAVALSFLRKYAFSHKRVVPDYHSKYAYEDIYATNLMSDFFFVDLLISSTH